MDLPLFAVPLTSYKPAVGVCEGTVRPVLIRVWDDQDLLICNQIVYNDHWLDEISASILWKYHEIVAWPRCRANHFLNEKSCVLISRANHTSREVADRLSSLAWGGFSWLWATSWNASHLENATRWLRLCWSGFLVYNVRNPLAKLLSKRSRLFQSRDLARSAWIPHPTTSSSSKAIGILLHL